jgi:predicted ArsR family transcriptional regulator
MCEHYLNGLKKGQRHYVNAPEYDNCILCLVNAKGPMTLQEIAKYLNISKMRVCQLQKIAEKKMFEKMQKYYD